MLIEKKIIIIGNSQINITKKTIKKIINLKKNKLTQQKQSNNAPIITK
jgi:hypothetical protein